MPEKILGIDIDEMSLKAVLAVRAMRGGYRVDRAWLINLSDAGGVAGAIDNIRGQVDFQQVRVNIALPTEHLSFHNVKFPFRDEKKIKQTVAYELETILPHSIEESLFDYFILEPQISVSPRRLNNPLEKGSAGPSEIFAAVVPRLVVKERLSLFGEYLPEIGLVGIDALPVASWLLTNRTFTGPGLLLDVRAQGAAAVFVQQGRIVQVRYFPLEEQTEAGGTERAAGETPQPKYQQFCRELANLLEFLKYGGIMEAEPERIFLDGDDSSLSLVKEALQRYLSLPVATVDLVALSGIHLSEELKKRWQPSSMNRAVALALLKHEKGRGFNFSLRDLETRKTSEQYGGTLKWAAIVTSCIAVLAATDAYTGFLYDRLYLNNLKKQIKTVFRSAAPEVTRIVEPIQQFKVKIAEMKKMTSGRGDITGGPSVLDILKDVSAAAPPSTEFLINSFNLDGDNVAIKATAKNFDSVNALKNEFARLKTFKAVEIGSTSMAKSGEKVEFDLRMTVQR